MLDFRTVGFVGRFGDPTAMTNLTIGRQLADAGTRSTPNATLSVR